ncbi:MAG: hypothetical protein U0Y68_05905 [Blastocatellia bacterium]
MACIRWFRLCDELSVISGSHLSADPSRREAQNFDRDFQRGAMDGLLPPIPYGEAAYYDCVSLAVPRLK